jgi:hypothetical protein
MTGKSDATFTRRSKYAKFLENCFASEAFSVGHDPHPLSRLRPAKVGSSQHVPPCIKPERGQVAEYASHSSNKERCDVFHEHEAGSNFTNDAGHVSPESAALSGQPELVAAVADVGAGEPAGDNINQAAPRSAVEGPHVVPYREPWQVPVTLSRKQHASRVGSIFNSADGAPSKEFSSQDATSCPCK